MKYLFVALALLAFVFAGFASQVMASDIQLILVVLGIVAGFLFVGFAAVLNEVRK